MWFPKKSNKDKILLKTTANFMKVTAVKVKKETIQV